MYLAWIYSKVKTNSPALPSADVVETTPAISGEPIKEPHGSVALPNDEKGETKRRRHSRKKRASITNLDRLPGLTTNDDDDGLTNSEYTSKTILKRVARALMH